jgi:hypothetical protein
MSAMESANPVNKIEENYPFLINVLSILQETL